MAAPCILSARSPPFPSGPTSIPNSIGQQLFYPLPWAIPLLWIAVILASRGVARLILRPWRKTQNYGFRLMGLTTGLALCLDLGLEPFATRVKHYWFWNPTKLKFDYYTTPWINFFGWGVTVLLILAFATPSLINKKPMHHSPAAGLLAAGRVAPAQPFIRDGRWPATPLAGRRINHTRQRGGRGAGHPRRALVAQAFNPRGFPARLPPSVTSEPGLAANR